jgi:hypothetical protein
MYTHNLFTAVNYPELLGKQRLLPYPWFLRRHRSREEPLDHHVLTAPPGGQRLPLLAPAAPDPGQVAGAVASYLALREFRARLYECLTSRADASFELIDAISCADPGWPPTTPPGSGTRAPGGPGCGSPSTRPHYPSPDAWCSPGREHVHNGACRCKGSSKTAPGWEYQFTAAIGHLRTAWAAFADVTLLASRSRPLLSAG